MPRPLGKLSQDNWSIIMGKQRWFDLSVPVNEDFKIFAVSANGVGD